MSNKTPVILALLLIFSIMIYKVVNNYQEIKLAKEKQNYKASILPLEHGEAHSTETDSVNTQDPVSQDHSILPRNTTSPSQTKAKGAAAAPNQQLEEGFEWTDEYYNPDKLSEPGYERRS